MKAKLFASRFINQTLLATLTLLSILSLQLSTFAQSTAFTYQGRLNDGVNSANGTYDLRFGLYTSDIGSNQVGLLLTNSAITISGGLFTVALDFGTNFPGPARWLEVAVQTNGSGAFIVLTPRQPVMPTPYALTAGGVSGTNITINGPLNLPATTDVIYSGNSLLLYSSGIGRNFFAGPGAGNLKMSGTDNTGTGYLALSNNLIGSDNTAMGSQALLNNFLGDNNTAIGWRTLFVNTSGSENTAIGYNALESNTSGQNNTAIGAPALTQNTTGNNNIAIGVFAGDDLTTGDNNICIGNFGFAGNANTIRIGTQNTQTNTHIAGIYGTTLGSGVAVYVNSSAQLGTMTSSARFKEDIKSMDDASDVLLSLHPVTFKYKPEIDPQGIPQFGLVAEEVNKVDPNLIVRDDKGKIYTVRYEAVNAMLLNEFLKEHRKVDELEKELSELKQAVKKLSDRKD